MGPFDPMLSTASFSRLESEFLNLLVARPDGWIQLFPTLVFGYFWLRNTGVVSGGMK